MTQHWPRLILPLIGFALASGHGQAVFATDAGKTVDFNRDIRPILSDKCFHCHGPDVKHREAGLRMDVEAAAKADLDGYFAIVAGKPEQSEAMVRVLDKDDPMPPIKSGKKLSAHEKDLLKRWIEQGAKYDTHWSFTPPVRPTPPRLADGKAAEHPIDGFILAKLQSKGMQLSPPADRHTLIRRVTLDLTGVPPTHAEVEAFMKDRSPDAYERLVDRLLASPRYGERMAQPWLDAARYADTMGYQADWERFQWRWRTWVIDAYNRNLPFDQFTIEQLAGDLLPNPTVEQLIATGFNRNHRINDEGGIIPEEYLVEYIVDRVETTAATWMGLTMGCARCHDHKYDPFSQRDFFQLFAYFNNVPEKGKDGRKGYASPHLRVAVRGKHEAYEQVKREVADAEAALAATNGKLGASRKQWITQMAAKLKAGQDGDGWQIIAPASVKAEGDAGPLSFKKHDDGSTLAAGPKARFPSYVIELKPDAGKVTGLRLEALRHPSHVRGSLSVGSGNFYLTEIVLTYLPAKGQPRPLKIASGDADYQQKDWPITGAFDGKKQTGWAVDGHAKTEDRTAVLTLARPLTLNPGDRLMVRLNHESQHPGRTIGRFRLSLTSMAKPAIKSDAGLPKDIASAIRQVAGKPASRRNAKQRQRLAAYHATIAPGTKAMRQRLQAAQKALATFEKQHTTYVMVMQEMATPRATHILDRGLYTEKRDKVDKAIPAGVLGVMPKDAPNNRLGLAKWLVSGNHPLTARVTVNRYWAMLFGEGLVRTAEDFGLQGEYPSHPQLLDYLATEYPRLGWDTKKLLKFIVTSDTYKQASTWTATHRERDPLNRLLGRQSRLRLPAEMIRDQALFTSGLLVERIGGKSVKPYQPAGLWSEVSFQSKKRTTDFYVMDSGEKLYRRSLYTFWKRSMPPPTMATFDAPSREMCILQRPRTNTPMQALALMNDVTYVEASRALAERTMRATEQDATARVEYIFRALLARPPVTDEAAVLMSGYQKRIAFFRANPAAAKKLISQGESKPRKDTDPIELAALTTTAMTIMNMDEAINRE